MARRVRLGTALRCAPLAPCCHWSALPAHALRRHQALEDRRGELGQVCTPRAASVSLPLCAGELVEAAWSAGEKREAQRTPTCSSSRTRTAQGADPALSFQLAVAADVGGALSAARQRLGIRQAQSTRRLQRSRRAQRRERLHDNTERQTRRISLSRCGERRERSQLALSLRPVPSRTRR